MVAMKVTIAAIPSCLFDRQICSMEIKLIKPNTAMITTAAGLSVAIVSLIFYRYFMRRVDTIVVEIEREAIKMVDVIHKSREGQI